MYILPKRASCWRGKIGRSLVIALAAGFPAFAGTLAATATTAGAVTPPPTGPFNECPAIGADTGCAILIVINNTGAQVLTDPSQGVYDGIEDTLVGVLNNTTSTTVNDIPLSGGSNDIFGFDGDGACDPNNGTTPFSPAPPDANTADTGTSGAPCTDNSTDTTGYGGPDSYFTNINSPTNTTGTVNFISPLTAGQTTWFSLEEAITGAELNVVTANASSISAVEGNSFSGPVATFFSSDTTTLASQYTATVDWGDGTPATAGVVSGGSGSFTVTGTHTYAEENDANQATITITDTSDGNTSTVQSPVTVTDAPLTAVSLTLSGGTEGVTPGTASFIFTDANPGATAADYTSGGGSVTVNWGDGSPVDTLPASDLSGPQSVAGGAQFTVNASHQYAEEGTYTVTVTVTDDGGSTAFENGTVTVADAPLMGGTNALSGGVEYVTPGTASFTFTDANPGATAADYTSGGGSVTVNWGDGSPVDTLPASDLSGPVSVAGGAQFTVNASHQYAEEGTYTVTVTVTDDGGSSTTTTGPVTVADAPIMAACATSAVSLQSFNGTVATLSDANKAASAADFIPVISGGNGGSTTINWGDGSASTAGTVSGSGGSYSITGSHNYTSTGYYTITVTVKDDGGSVSTASPCTVLVYAFAKGGSFVIGNGNSANKTAVTFWGAQWAKDNSLSGGSAPSSFKGFEDSAAPPACGTSWTADPGNSTPPPSWPLPAYMGVIVSSSITQSGSTISGNTPNIVVVMTNSGYAPDPGHAGTGTVVAQACGGGVIVG